MFGVEPEDKHDRGVGFVMNKCCRFFSAIRISSVSVAQLGYGVSYMVGKRDSLKLPTVDELPEHIRVSEQGEL